MTIIQNPAAQAPFEIGMRLHTIDDDQTIGPKPSTLQKHPLPARSDNLLDLHRTVNRPSSAFVMPYSASSDFWPSGVAPLAPMAE